MCFSATASFTAGLVLTGLGAASVKAATRPAHLPLAGVPFLFAFQQFTEGVLWLSLTHPAWEGLREIATYAFLMIAHVLWPLWLPVAFIFFEENEKRRKWMKVFLGSGIVAALYFLVCLIMFPVEAREEHRHIFYELSFPLVFAPFAAFLYVLGTAVPPLLSTNRKVQAVGLVILIFYILSRLYFKPNLVSVWCYFGTTIAVFIFMALRERVKVKSVELAVE